MKDKELSINKIALKNLFYQKIRTGLMIFFVVLMSSTLFFSMAIMDNMNRGVNNTKEKMGADIIVIPRNGTEEVRESIFQGKPCTVLLDKNWEKEIAKMDGVEKISSQLYIATLSSSCCDAAVQLIAIDQNTDFVITPWLKSKNKINLNKMEVIVGHNIYANPGQKIVFYNTEFTVVDKLDKTGMGYDNTAFMSFETIYELQNKKEFVDNNLVGNIEDKVSMITLNVKEGYTANVYKIDIQNSKALPQEIYACTTDDFIKEVSKQVNTLTGYGGILMGVVVFSTALALICIFIITINERKMEFGIIAAIGGKPRIITHVILLEALFVCFAGSVIGTFFSIAVLSIFKNLIGLYLNIPFFYLDASQIIGFSVICICASAFAGIVAAIYASYNMSKKEPYWLMVNNG